MKDRIQLTFWNYNNFFDYEPKMLRDWVNLGMTSPMTPRFSMKNDSHELFRKMLDEAETLGITMVLNIDELFLDNYRTLGEDGYRRQCAAIYDEFCHHPAVSGVYVGEEPNTDTEPSYFGGVRILRELSRDIEVFINLGSTERTERMLLKGERDLSDWCCDFTEKTGTDVIGYGTYTQLLPNGVGIYEHFENLRRVVAAGKRAGADIWASLLSSAHCEYRIATENDYRWQLTTAVACGCRAVAWFRIYDKLIAGDYYGAPIDEFGELTNHSYDLARTQKNFNAHYAEIFARLHHQETYGIGVAYGGYLYFLQGLNDLVDGATGRQGLISFFTDDDGGEYAVIVNTLQNDGCAFSLSFSDKVERVEKLLFNGKSSETVFSRDGRSGSIQTPESWLSPGQLVLLKLTRRA